MCRRNRVTVLISVLLIAVTCISTAAYSAEDSVIGTVEELLKGNTGLGSELSGTPLGYAVADAMMAAAETDMAIANGGDVIHNLDAGEVTLEDVSAVFSEDRAICTVSVTAAGLKAILETTVAGIATGEDDAIDVEKSESEGFAQPAGFSYICDCSAQPGSRIIQITREDMSLKLDDDKVFYTLAVTDRFASGGYGGPVMTSEETGWTLVEALASAVSRGQLQKTYKDRVAVIGSTDNSILSWIPVGMLLLVGVLFGEYRYRKYTRYDTTRHNYRNDRGYARPDHYKNK